MNANTDRMILGGLAGISATMLMTAAMWRMHAYLPRDERYPLPPREITEKLPTAGIGEDAATLAYHFAYGGLTGAIFAALCRRPTVAGGIAYGTAVWTASYLGWIPAFGVLKWATCHPARRNALMLAAHAVWGSGLALGLADLQRSISRAFPRSITSLPDVQNEKRQRS